MDHEFAVKLSQQRVALATRLATEREKGATRFTFEVNCAGATTSWEQDRAMRGLIATTLACELNTVRACSSASSAETSHGSSTSTITVNMTHLNGML